MAMVGIVWNLPCLPAWTTRGTPLISSGASAIRRSSASEGVAAEVRVDDRANEAGTATKLRRMWRRLEKTVRLSTVGCGGVLITRAIQGQRRTASIPLDGEVMGLAVMNLAH
jgi:hypothetical protein